MSVRDILKMGDPRLLRVAEPVQAFNSPELKALVEDMFETMRAVDGAGLAAPQIGVDLALVIFGFSKNDRYPDAPPVPETVLINPQIEALLRAAGRRLGRLPVGTGPARRGATLGAHSLHRVRLAGPAHRTRGGRFSCPGGAARM